MTIGMHENNLTSRKDMDEAKLQQPPTVVFSLPNTTNMNRGQSLRGDDLMLLGRRRTIARMMRVELEITVGILNKALECCAKGTLATANLKQ